LKKIIGATAFYEEFQWTMPESPEIGIKGLSEKCRAKVSNP